MRHADDHVRQLLAHVASGRPVSKRSLARDLGMALGLTNLLLRQLSSSGWIRVVRFKPNRVRYLITAAGLAEHSRRSREYFQRNVRFYAETRDLIRHNLERLAATNGDPPRRIAFFGAGEVAELAYVAVAEMGLHLVAVVDEERTRSFFGVPVQPMAQLNGDSIGDQPYDVLVVMSFADPGEIRRRLERLGVPDRKVHWLQETPSSLARSANVPPPGGRAAGKVLEC